MGAPGLWRMDLSRAPHCFRSYLAFFYEFEKYSLELVLNRRGRIFV